MRARAIAKDIGVRHAYIGNVHHVEAQSSYCAGCGKRVIERDWHLLSDWQLDGAGCCTHCGTQMPGVFDGPPGDWGRKRRSVRLVEAG